MPTKTLHFPIIKQVEINNFSLYKSKNKITLNFNSGVFCLAGANGLGKSTFINILNYGLTGIVKRPNSNFSQFGSIPQFYSKNKSFASEYFDQRIEENQRETASIKIEFKVQNYLFILNRKFFEQDSIAKLSIIKDDRELISQENLTPTDLNNKYQKYLIEAIGLEDFDQFVFLQFFVFTFDETHQLLFWDTSLMERVLYLMINLDASQAKMADSLRKEITVYESSMRNLQWDKTQKEKELTTLLDNIESSVDSQSEISADIMDNYQKLSSDLTETLENLQKIEEQLKECNLLLADYSLKNIHFKQEYEYLFNKTFNQPASLEKDSTVINLLSKIKKTICDKADASNLLNELKEFISNTKCIDSSLTDNKETTQKLKEIDELIFKNQNEQNNLQKRKDRLLEAYEEFKNEAEKTKLTLDNIEKENDNFRMRFYINQNPSNASALTTNLKQQIEKYDYDKKQASADRDKKKEELNKLERELSRKYLEAESSFIPIFINYAKEFLGLDVNIYLQSYSKGPTLIVEVNNTQRREKYQLSESQRFFIDIALRMSLIEYSSKNATLLIDTPEGSLDIAYESRAGSMFADFVEKGYDLIMTANINSSMLLKKLAQKSKSNKMILERMTNWTILSEVQQQEYKIIDEAFEEIETLINS